MSADYLPLALSAFGVFYIVAGYPVLLALWRGRKAPGVAKSLSFTPRVSIILAVHNGAAYIRSKLESLLAFDYPKDRLEILVVSDGSDDDTDAIAQEFESQGITLIPAPRAGKAAALNRGIARATGEIVFFTDVRQPLEPDSLRHLAANFADPSVGGVTGQLVLLRGDSGEQADMDLYWRYELWSRKRHSAIDSLFTTTGCIYAMRRSLIEPLALDTIADDAFHALHAFFRGYRIVFDPEAIGYDYPALSGTEFRRRFRTLAGLWQVHARIPELFTRRNRMRFHFLSHKFSRLALPWLILLFVASTLALPDSDFRNVLLGLEAAFAALALLNRFVPDRSALKRITSPIQTFLILNAASIASVAVFFVPPARIWSPTRVQPRMNSAEQPPHL
jgi:cellulose synthase/poly-beta-1,6-N-acetylglucosamine synthase-like glycosyltransferase